VLDDSRVYGFRSNPLGNMLHPRTTYTLYAAAKNPAAAPPEPARDKKGARRRRRGPALKHHWQVANPGLFVNAMVLGKDRLFIAGPPDVADETKMLGFLPGADDDHNRQLSAQDEAWRGRRGGLLQAVSAEDGKKLAESKLDSIPVFDGMAAAGGKLFLSLQDGRVICLGGK
jgi:hypothetical protein